MKIVLLTAMMAAIALGACELGSSPDYFSDPGSCAQYTACTETFCGTFGVNNTGNAYTCATNTSVSTCGEFSGLVGEFINCVISVAMDGECQTGESAFATLGVALNDDSASGYATGNVYKGCSYAVCNIVEAWGAECAELDGSSSGTMYGGVCKYTASMATGTTSSSAEETENENSESSSTSSAASVSTAVLAVLATLALLL
jgi:hypothetical protein